MKGNNEPMTLNDLTEEATPLPWVVRPHEPGKCGGHDIVSAQGLICQMQFHPAEQKQALSNAHLIVHRVNTYPEMVEALVFYQQGGNPDDGVVATMALAKANNINTDRA